MLKKVNTHFNTRRSLSLIMVSTISLLLLIFFLNTRSRDDNLLKTEIKDTASAIEYLSSIYKFPGNKNPKVSRVNKSALSSGNKFFMKAKENDLVFYFENEKTLVLLDSVTKRIIDVALIADISDVSNEKNKTEVTINNETDTKTPELPKLAFLSGSKDLSSVSNIEKKLEEKFKFKSVARAMAFDTYSETLVISVSDIFLPEAYEISRYLGATISTLPTKEKVPEGADILVITVE